MEIQFRAWKQALNLGKALNRKSGEHHMQALVLAGMIAHQLGMKIAQRIGNIVGRAWLSYEKLYDLLAVRLIKASGLADVAACDPAKDTGIDLVAKTHGTEEFHAIQYKCFAEDYRVRKADIVTTTNDWSENAENSLHSQTPPVYKIDLYDLETSQIDWAKYQPSAAPALKPKKELRPHQTSAKAKVTHGLASADRGKLIMACGTGKTFTSLKIAEEVAGKDKRVLFLVPSLNLLSQTLTEWTQESAIPLHSFAVCSDVEVGKKRNKDEDIVETFAHELVECWSFLLK